MGAWNLSAATGAELRDLAGRLHTQLREGADPSEVGRALAAEPPRGAHRAVLLGGADGWSSSLSAVADGRPDARVVDGVAVTAEDPVFVFPGQGTVFDGMGSRLLQSSPVFRRRMLECADALAPHADPSVGDLLRRPDAAAVAGRPDLVEPVLFAIMVSLAELWKSHGVRPRAVLGFSLGEIAAACVAGALSLDEAARVAVLWSRAHVPLVGRGRMAMIGMSPDEVAARLCGPGTDLEVAGVFAPRSVVVSGSVSAVDAAVESIREEGGYAENLSVDFPAHSRRVHEQRSALLAALGPVTPRSVELPFYSCTAGGLVDTAEMDGEYWYRNLRSPVLFERAARAMLADGHRVAVELSVHPVLLASLRDVAHSAGVDARAVGTLRRDQQGEDRVLAVAAEAYVHGVPVDWTGWTTAGAPAEPPRPDDAPVGGPADPGDGSGLVASIVDHVVAEVACDPGAGGAAGGNALAGHPRDANLFDLGLDSIQMVRLQTTLERRLDVRLESTFLIDHPGLDALVAELRRVRSGREAPDRSVAGPPPAPSADGPVAVVGMAFRLPGGIRDRRQLWDVLSGETDVVGEVPLDRWSHSTLDLSEVTTTQGGYLPDVDRFDAAAFGISPAEADLIDPQQRLLLELTWEAFEDAGLDPFAIGAEQRVGTFVGIYNNDYRQVGCNLGFPHEAYTYTGNMANAAAGRISFVYGFRGPSMAIDTACSSSLYALHLGRRELRHGVCDLVVAAGVNLILSPEGHLSWSRLGALSPSGRCRSFDDGADGYIRSEGGVVVVLKRLADAERDGDDVLAVLSGSAVSHNGRSGGFTVPSGTAQSQVVADAMADAGVGIEDVSYVEAHGSGTPVGDPQEINALARVFAGRSRPVGVGSVKSNLGHLESAAGLAALCKVVVAIEHRRLPGTLHFRRGNSLIDWDAVPVEVIADERPWEPAGGRLRAGISSFGISGTNAHVVVEEHVVDRQAGTADRPHTSPGTPQLLLVSAGSPAALQTGLRELAGWSTGVAGAELADVAHTLRRRRALRYRAALVCSDLAELPAAVDAAVAEPAGWAGEPGPVFLFSGQGTQYPGMARELYDATEAFRRELDELDAAFREAGGIELLDVMFGDGEDPFPSPRYSQPMIFAVQLALVRQWAVLGVIPAAVLGHSIGEYAAACTAGVLDRAQAVDLVMRRALVMEATPRTGAMATLLCSVDRVRELLVDVADVAVAAVNAAENVTVSGAADGVTEVLRAARRRRIFTERLDVSHPFHSPLMSARADELHAQIRDQHFAPAAVPWFSTRTGRLVPAGSAIDAGYWSRHLVDPVLFRDAVAAAVGAGHRTFLEIGATATVGGLVAQQADDVVVVPSLRRGTSEVRQLLHGAGRLWEAGARLAPTGLDGEQGRLRHDLPHTPFDRRRTWYRDRDGEAGTTVVNHAAGPTPENRTTEVPTTDDPSTRQPASATEAGVVAFVVDALSRITGLDAAALDRSSDLFALGVDSLMLVQLGKRLARQYGLDIPIKEFFTSLHTVGQVAAHVLVHGTVRPEPPEVATVPVPGPVPGPGTAPAAPDSGMQAVVQAQLALMSRQLELLAGRPMPDTVPDPCAPAPVPAARAVGTYTNNIALAEDPLTDRQRRFVVDLVAEHTARTRRSKEYADLHRGTLADWIVSLNFDPSLREVAYPVVSARSDGAGFQDLDGNEYIDTGMGYGVHFFGHQPDFVLKAVREQLDAGFELGPQNRIAGEVAQLVHRMTGAERVTFCNTGTEAVMVSLRLARAVSGRDRIVRFTDSYHGSSDGVLAESDGTGTVPLTIGIPQAAVDETVVLPYGREESLAEIRRLGDGLAAVLVEPVQSRNPGLQPREFLHELRRICDAHDIALIFDEMIVGFRVGPGGAQAHFDVRADMSLYGKLVGGGMPVGIVAGRSRYLDAVDGGTFTDVDGSAPAVPTTFFAGTFCKHPLTMAACRAVLTRLQDDGGAAQATLNLFTDDFVRRANAWFEAEQVPVALSHFASIYKFDAPAQRDRSTMTLTQNLFFKLLTHHGVYVWERRAGCFSLAHTEEHKERILEVFRIAVAALRAGGFDFRRADAGGPRAAVEPPAPSAGSVTEPVTAEEKRIYVLSRMRGGNQAYQVPVRLRLDGRVDPERVAAAFRALTRRHAALRRGFVIESGEVVARVLAEVEPEAHLFDLARDPGITEEHVADVVLAPFALDAPPLWRYGLVDDPDGTQHLLASFHHAVVDGRGLEILLDELAEYLTTGRLPDRPGAGADHAAFVRLQARTPPHAEDRRWWHQEFADPPPPLALPTDAPIPVVNDFAGRHHHSRIDPALHDATTALVARLRTTPFLFHLAVWSALLSRICGGVDQCIGVPLDQRRLGPFDRTVGMFAQSLPLRLRPTPSTRFADHLRQVRDTCLAAIEHASYSYDALVHDLDLVRDHGRNPLFDVMFIHTDARARARRFGPATATTEDLGMRGSMLAMTLELTERDGGLHLDLNHSDVYDERRIARVVEQYQILLAAVVSDPDRALGDLPLLDEATTSRLLSWGGGPADPDVPPLAELFATSFATYADRPAVRFRGVDTTYAQLSARADALAALLRGGGAAAGDVVGLLLPPSPDLVAAMLAVHRVGGTWLPLDTGTPPERLRSMVGTAAPVLLLCAAAGAAGPEPGVPVVVIDTVVTDAGSVDASQPPAAVSATPGSADDLAYVIFTSGSTGRPKGVTVTNGALANFLRAMPTALRWEEGATVACLTTPSFDIHLLETLLTLVTGGRVVLADEQEVRTPDGIARFVTANAVRYLQMTPSRLRLLCADTTAAATALGPLGKLVVGGEAFPGELLADLRRWTTGDIFNVYGPTETCIWSSVKDLGVGSDMAVTIGAPIGNTFFAVLDDDLALVPEDAVGQLWIGGAGVSPGYLNQPELTAEAFRDNPFGAGRLYRTGDLARWRDGEVLCLGRVDNQVKVRGHRIELEEIELVLAGHELVSGAAAVTVEIAPGNRVIRGFYRLVDGAEVDQGELRTFLAGRLADYMLPATLTAVAELPLTTSGKVDRAALARRIDERPAPPPVDLSDDVGLALFAAWRAVLGDVAIGEEQSFFDVGGNSFSLVLLLEELHTVFPGVLDVSDLFAHPTIGSLHRHLERELAGRGAAASSAEAAVQVPASWVRTDGTDVGRARADVPQPLRAALRRAGDQAGRSVPALVRAAFAYALSTLTGAGRVTLCVVTGPGRVVPVRLDLEGRTDLAQVVDDYERAVAAPEQAVPLDRLVAAAGAEGRVLVACSDQRTVDDGDLLRHVDIVLSATEAADDGGVPAALTVTHRPEIDPAAALRLLRSHLTLLGMVDAPAAPPSSTNPSADRGPGAHEIGRT